MTITHSKGFLPECDPYHTCPADFIHLLPADLLQTAAEVAQRSPGAAEGLRGQADSSVVPTVGEGNRERRSSLGQEKYKVSGKYSLVPHRNLKINLKQALYFPPWTHSSL